jgi:two-component system response regulator FixJ
MNTIPIPLIDCKGHIFLIEDDINLSDSLVSSLEYLGYRVHAFSCAEEFFRSDLSSFIPAVILSDISLPGLSGIELQAKLIDLERLIPIIFISGECSVSESISGMKQGAIEFLTKPFRRDDLINAIIQGIEIDRNDLKRIHLKVNAMKILDKLAPREREVFNLLVIGSSNHQVSVGLDLSMETVKQYKKQIKQKLELSNLTEFILLSKNST